MGIPDRICPIADGSKTFIQTLPAIFNAVDRPIAPIIALVLAVVRATVGAVANTISALLPELHSILDTVTDIVAPVFATLDTRIDTVIYAQISQRNAGKGQESRHNRQCNDRWISCGI